MRNRRLDVLRCVAVLLIILHHGDIIALFTNSGWIGVDLFFVLSGFLISGLLFSEYKKRSSINCKRFYIRRALKIYPVFYVFLFLTGLVWHFYLHDPPSLTRLLHEIFFVQNYEQPVWGHTWSLAVEEHFYILLPILLLLLMRYSADRKNPFRAIPWCFAATAVACVAFRAESAYLGQPNLLWAYSATHERFDSLFFGVLIGYFYNFHGDAMANMMSRTRNRVGIAAVSATLVFPAIYLAGPRGNRLFATFGYSLLYVGAGGILLLSLYVHRVLPKSIRRALEPVGTCLAFIGMYSYPIYLWNMPAAAWFPGLMRRAMHFPNGPYSRFAVYCIANLVIGIGISRIMEYPVLRLRDRLFPAAGATRISGSEGASPSASNIAETAPST